MDTRKDLNYRLYLQKESGFIRTSFQSEFSRYKDIQEGNIAKVRENFSAIRADFYNGKGTLSADPVRNIRYHMIISTAITARICVEGGMNHDEAYTLSDIYIQTVDKLNSFEDILNCFEKMQLDFAYRMQEVHKKDVISLHIRKCIDYIYDHLQEKLTIQHLATQVNLNPTYLSKLFFSETGMNIHDFITETRITTAKNMLQDSDIPYITIAISLGFSSQSSFIATFRKRTNMTPKEYRNKYYGKDLLADKK